MTGIDINKKLESFNNLIQEFGKSTFSSRDIWNRKKEIDENFKAAQFESTDEKEKTISHFQQLVSQIEQKEKEVEIANEEFSAKGEALVKTFDEQRKLILSKEVFDREDYKNLRYQANEIFEYFKQQRWASKERRTTAWDIYNNARNLIKDKEDEVMSKERDERNKLSSQSLEITEKVCVVVNACHPSISAEDLQNYVIKFNNFLQENNLQNENCKWFLIEKPEDVKLSLKSRSETINDVRNFVMLFKDNILREHKSQIYASIDALKDDLNKAWEQLKIDQQKRQEEWEIKKKERDEKRIEWNKKQQEFLAFLEKRLENQISYKAKQESYLQSQKEFAQRFENRIPAQQAYIKKLIEQVIDLEKKHATAWTDSFKTKVEEWITEKKEKIANVEADIEVLKSKVADINKNISEFPKRIEELDNSIKEISDKIVEVKTKLENDKIQLSNDNLNIELPIQQTPNFQENETTSIVESNEEINTLEEKTQIL